MLHASSSKSRDAHLAVRANGGRFGVKHARMREAGRPIAFDGCTMESAASRGIDPQTQETYENGVRKTIYRDPDGNELGFGGAPVGDGTAGR